MTILATKMVNTVGGLREVLRHLPDETPLALLTEEGKEVDVEVTEHSEHNAGDRQVVLS